MTNKLASKVTLVTGSRHRPRHCEAFRHEGARVFITLPSGLMDQAVASIGGDARANQADSSNLARPGNSRFPRRGVDPGLAV